MASYVKNPFGKRDGKLIMIGDLSSEERGARCNCVCPECEGKFNARMGTKRRPHFAHEKDSMCDEEKVFLESMYSFLCEGLEEDKRFCYPGLYGFYPGVDVRRKASRNDIMSVLSFTNIEPPAEADYEKIIAPNTVSVQRAEIVRNSKDLPEAVLMYVESKGKEHVLALCIEIPPNICKTREVRKYKNVATVVIPVTDKLYTTTSDELRKELLYNVSAKGWIYSPAVEKWIEGLLELQHEAHKAYIERITKEKEEREYQRKLAMEIQAKEKAEVKRKTEERRIQQKQMWEKCKSTVEMHDGNIEGSHQGLSQNETIFSRWLSIENGTPPTDKHVRDMNGNRWGLCDECNQWFPDREMPLLGGPGDRMNRGICRWCDKKIHK